MDAGDHNLLEGLKLLPDWVEVSAPAGRLEQAIRAEIEARMSAAGLTWIGSKEANELLPFGSRRTLRRKANRWSETQRAGERPPVRVRKKNDKPNSDWEFCLEDCRSYDSRTPDLPEVPDAAAADGSPTGSSEEGSAAADIDLGGLNAHLAA